MASPLRYVNPTLSDGTFYVLEYNGFRFDPAATETLSVSCRPIQDEAKRTVKYVEITLTVRTDIYISALDLDDDNVQIVSTDIDMDDAIQRLTSQGGSLNYQGKGFGSLNINTSVNDGNIKYTGQWDVAWGPTPTLVESKPIADNCAWRLTWSVKVCIPECDQASYQNTIMSFNYWVDYTTDYGGYLTRTIKGHIEIPLTRQSQGDRQITTTADDFRDQIVCQVPSGFRDAGGGSYTLSEDRRRLDFQFVHQQLPGIVPPLGVLKCSMSMRTQNAVQQNFVKWLFSIDATYEMAAGNFQKAAAVHFRRVVADRIIRLSNIVDPLRKAVNNGAGILPKDQKGALPPIVAKQPGFLDWLNPTYDEGNSTIDTINPTVAVAAAAQVAGGAARTATGFDAFLVDDDTLLHAMLPKTISVFPIFYSAEDPDAYGKPMARFSCTLCVFNTEIQLFNGGLWEPIKDTPEWTKWRASLGKIWDPRGIANMGYDPADDLIIDLCRSTVEAVTQSGIGEQRLGANDPNQESLFDQWLGEFKRVVKKQAGESVAVATVGEYVTFVNNITYDQEDDTVYVKKLPTDSALDNQYAPVNGKTVDTRWFQNAGNQFNIVTGGTTVETQTKFMSRVSPDYTVTIEGYAVRIGNAPASPELVSLAGVPCVPLSRTQKTEVIGNVGTPMYKTSWVKTYALPQHQGTVIDPSNMDSQGGASLNSAGGVGSSTLKNVGA